MKILHIIPSAFDYFDDIKLEAFEMLESENKMGVESDAITLEYGTVSRSEKFEVSNVAPSRQYLGQQPLDKNFQAWGDYDIINLHCPFLGEARKILNFFVNNPNKILILTYHRDFITTDFFSFFIKLYNYYYLPKLFKQAKVVGFMADRRNESIDGINMIKNDSKAVVLGLVQDPQDIHTNHIVQDLIMVYNNIVVK